jgi:hypothetical protein
MSLIPAQPGNPSSATEIASTSAIGPFRCSWHRKIMSEIEG